MNDLVLETCKYVYKNPNKTKEKYIFDMSKRSIWYYSYDRTTKEVETLLLKGVLKEVDYSIYRIVKVDIESFASYYGVVLSGAELKVLDYVYNNPKKSKSTVIGALSNYLPNVVDVVNKLGAKSIIRYRTEVYNNYKYSSPYIDLYSLHLCGR